MDRERMKQLQAINHRVNRHQTQLASEFVTQLKEKLAKRKYRADLCLTANSNDTSGRFLAQIKFDPGLGYPAEKDIITLVAQAYPDHDVDWENINVEDGDDIIMLMLEPSMEVVPVESVKQIPPEFVSIGSGIYKRAVDASGETNEIWTLKKTEDGLALFRSQDDLEVTAEDNGGPRSGDPVETEYGVGIVKRFDDLGNAFVQVGNKTHLVNAAEMKPFSIDKEKRKLEDYFAEAYGVPEYAKGLVEDYGDKNKKK